MAAYFSEPASPGNSSAYWHRKMSNNLAAALVLFAGLQIFVISAVVANGATSLLYHLGIALLIAAIVPAARNMERRWEILPEGLSGDGRAERFRRDQVKLWSVALFLPLLWIPIGWLPGFAA